MNKSVKVMLLALIALSVISCASAPKTSGMPDSLTQARTSAENLRQKAIDIKANVAAKANFDQGETGLNAAKALEASSDFENATTGYNGAADFYKKAYEEAAAKKEAATKAMNTAADERKTSEDILTQAAQEKAAAEAEQGE